MPRKKNVSVAGLTKLSSDYSATLENTPPPSPSPSPPPLPAKKTLPQKQEDNKEEQSDSDAEETKQIAQNPSISKKKREYSEAHKEVLRERLVKMHAKQKDMRETKKAEKLSNPNANPSNELFEKKYKGEFDFIKDKISNITNDIDEMKTYKREKAERKKKEHVREQKHEPIKDTPRKAEIRQQQPEKQQEAKEQGTEEPLVMLSFRQRFRK
jgi:hypothetical protein